MSSKLRFTAPVVAALVALLIMAGPAAASTFTPPSPSGTLYVDSGSFGASYTIVNRYTSLAAQTIASVGVMRDGLGDTEALTAYVWKTPFTSPTSFSIPTGSAGVPGISSASASISLANNEDFYVGYLQPSGFHAPYWYNPSSTSAATIVSTIDHTGTATDLTSGGWVNHSPYWAPVFFGT